MKISDQNTQHFFFLWALFLILWRTQFKQKWINRATFIENCLFRNNVKYLRFKTRFCWKVLVNTQNKYILVNFKQLVLYDIWFVWYLQHSGAYTNKLMYMTSLKIIGIKSKGKWGVYTLIGLWCVNMSLYYVKFLYGLIIW